MSTPYNYPVLVALPPGSVDARFPESGHLRPADLQATSAAPGAGVYVLLVLGDGRAAKQFTELLNRNPRLQEIGGTADFVTVDEKHAGPFWEAAYDLLVLLEEGDAQGTDVFKEWVEIADELNDSWEELRKRESRQETEQPARRQQGDWAYESEPPAESSFVHGPLVGDLKQLARWTAYDVRILRQRLGKRWWIQRDHARQYRIWFRTAYELAQATEQQTAEEHARARNSAK